MCVVGTVGSIGKFDGILCCVSHAGADLFLMGGKLDVEDDDTVDPGFNVYNGV